MNKQILNSSKQNMLSYNTAQHFIENHLHGQSQNRNCLLEHPVSAFKGTVTIILSNPPYKGGSDRFITVFLTPKSDN